MRFFKKSVLFSLVICLSLFAFGCGSDDDDDNDVISYNNSVLDGTHFMGIFAEETSDDSMWDQIDDIVFDGLGGYDSSIVYDSTGESGDYSGTYTVTVNGDFTMPGTDVIGIVSSDGSKTSFTDTAPAGTDKAIYLGISVEKSSGSDESVLNGDYVFCQIRHDGDRTKTSRLSMEFDGAGTATGNIDADTDDSTGALGGSYTVADDGKFDLTITGIGKDFTGHVSRDGNLIVVLDIDDDGEVLLMVGLKTTTGADASILSGNYQMNMFGGDDSSNWTTMIDARSDGAGTITATILVDSGGDTGEYTMGYTVAADGTMKLTDSGDSGIVSPDGEMFVVVNTGDDEGDVILVIGMKKQ